MSYFNSLYQNLFLYGPFLILFFHLWICLPQCFHTKKIWINFCFFELSICPTHFIILDLTILTTLIITMLLPMTVIHHCTIDTVENFFICISWLLYLHQYDHQPLITTNIVCAISNTIYQLLCISVMLSEHTSVFTNPSPLLKVLTFLFQFFKVP